MVRYEQGAYGLRAEGKALMPDRLAEVWLETNRPYYGDAVELPEGYRFGWAYIPHFIHTRFYTYAYVFAHLASLALYAKYREDGDAFVGPYLDFLSIGGAASPQEQLAAHRPRHLARRLLGRGVRRDRAADRDGRGDRADGVVARRALDAALMRAEPRDYRAGASVLG